VAAKRVIVLRCVPERSKTRKAWRARVQYAATACDGEAMIKGKAKARGVGWFVPGQKITSPRLSTLSSVICAQWANRMKLAPGWYIMRRNTEFWTYAFLRWTRSSLRMNSSVNLRTKPAHWRETERCLLRHFFPWGCFPFHNSNLWMPSGLTGGPGSYLILSSWASMKVMPTREAWSLVVSEKGEQNLEQTQ